MQEIKRKLPSITSLACLCLIFTLSACGGSSSSDTSSTDSTDTEDSSDTTTDTDTDTTTDADTSDNGLWMVNTNQERSTTIFEDGSNQGVLVNVQSVQTITENGQDYVQVEASGIPNYLLTITQDLLDELSARPNAASDFSGGATSAQVGDSVSFGEDIGYNTRTGGTCDETGGSGFWPPGPDCPQDTEKTGNFPSTPVANTETCDTGLGAIGYFLNGTSIYDWNDGQSYNSQGTWRNTAAKAEVHDLDICSGHAAQGDYHHHNWSSCLAEQIGDDGESHSPVYGYAADGYAVYGPWHSNGTLAKSAWVARDYADPSSSSGCGVANERSCVLVDQYDLSQGTTSAGNAGPDSNETITSQSGNPIVAASGLYFEDYYYDAALTASSESYLDQHNGHEHDSLAYHYHLTQSDDGNGNLTPAFPYTFGPTFKGELDTNTLASCGTSNSMLPPPPPF